MSNEGQTYFKNCVKIFWANQLRNIMNRMVGERERAGGNLFVWGRYPPESNNEAKNVGETEESNLCCWTGDLAHRLQTLPFLILKKDQESVSARFSFGHGLLLEDKADLKQDLVSENLHEPGQRIPSGNSVVGMEKPFGRIAKRSASPSTSLSLSPLRPEPPPARALASRICRAKWIENSS